MVKEVAAWFRLHNLPTYLCVVASIMLFILNRTKQHKKIVYNILHSNHSGIMQEPHAY